MINRYSSLKNFPTTSSTASCPRKLGHSNFLLHFQWNHSPDTNSSPFLFTPYSFIYSLWHLFFGYINLLLCPENANSLNHCQFIIILWHCYIQTWCSTLGISSWCNFIWPIHLCIQPSWSKEYWSRFWSEGLHCVMYCMVIIEWRIYTMGEVRLLQWNIIALETILAWKMTHTVKNHKQLMFLVSRTHSDKRYGSYIK